MLNLKKGIITLALCFFAANVFAANLKVGIIDPQELFSKSPQSKAAEKKIVKAFRNREEEVISKRKDLEIKVTSYKKDQEILSQKERLKREREINKLRQEFQRLASNLEVDVKVKRNEELQAFDKVFKDAVSVIAKEERFDLILPAQAVIYSGDKIDISTSNGDIYIKMIED